ncbi:MAG: NAD(P)H-quinone dehydrogenase [Propionibacteriaceae bacterium]|nr:NAD(P)H-quinone dehydrogenase [Propionibacteriaceae bacterium]
MTNVVIIGGGPGGYEAALVAAQLGGKVTLVEKQGLGGSAVLTDVVPSKGLIATAEVMTKIRTSGELGMRPVDTTLNNLLEAVVIDSDVLNTRLRELAAQQSVDIEARLISEGVRCISGCGRLDGTRQVLATLDDGSEEELPADITLIATGARPRQMAAAMPDGERILNWTQLYNLPEMPTKLIVVGSGVTGAEFASAYFALGCEVVLISSRRQVLPSQDDAAARVIQEAFQARGMTILSESRAASARREGDGVVVTLSDGRLVEGSHVLMAVGAIPNTESLALDEAGIQLTESGHIKVDRVSRTTARGVYAAGDVTGILALASVAAMQGRTAMYHALGDAVSPLNLRYVSANVFTSPEVASVGVTQQQIDTGTVRGRAMMMPLNSNARAKMQGLRYGFIKVFCSPSGVVIGGVVVAPGASELIHSLAIAIRRRLTVDHVAQAFTVYPSLSGSIAEAARRLHVERPDEYIL